jgi:hypothetical protein
MRPGDINLLKPSLAYGSMEDAALNIKQLFGFITITFYPMDLESVLSLHM